jgi:hypothetical protein
VLPDAQDASLRQFWGVEMNNCDCLLFHNSVMLITESY